MNLIYIQKYSFYDQLNVKKVNTIYIFDKKKKIVGLLL